MSGPHVEPPAPVAQPEMKHIVGPADPGCCMECGATWQGGRWSRPGCKPFERVPLPPAPAAQDGPVLGEEERERYGRIVREAWVRWARTQPNPKPSWLVPWEELPESDREADRCIADALVAAAEERGAAAERERIVATLYDWADNDVDLTDGDCTTLRLAAGRLDRGLS